MENWLATDRSELLMMMIAGKVSVGLGGSHAAAKWSMIHPQRKPMWCDLLDLVILMEVAWWKPISLQMCIQKFFMLYRNLDSCVSLWEFFLRLGDFYSTRKSSTFQISVLSAATESYPIVGIVEEILLPVVGSRLRKAKAMEKPQVTWCCSSTTAKNCLSVFKNNFTEKEPSLFSCPLSFIMVNPGFFSCI